MVEKNSQYIPHGSTWFNNKWKDWINYKEEIKVTDPEKEKLLKSLRGENDNG